MALTVKRTGAKEYGRYIKALICGHPGSGKTLISSTWPNPLYASAEGGLMSVADRNIPFVEIKSSDDLLALKVALDQAPEVREKMFGFQVDTIIVDTIDEIQRIFIRERLEETKKEALVLQDWGWLGEQMKTVIRSLRNLDMNVVLTCHIKETQDSESGKLFFKPAMQGAIGDEVSAYVDLSLLLKAMPTSKIVNGEAKRELSRYLQSYVDGQHPWIKDRSGKLPQEFPVNFIDDYDRLNELIFGGLEKLQPSEETIIDSPEVPGLEQAAPIAPPAAPPKAPAAPKTPKAPAKAKVPPPVEPTAPQHDETNHNGTSDDTVAVDPITGETVNTKTGEIVAAPEPEKAAPTEPVSVEIAGLPACSKCGNPVESMDQADLSRIRFRMILCKADFVAAKTAKK